MRGLLAPGSQHSQAAGQHGAAHAEAQGVQGVRTGDLLCDADGLDDGVLDVVVPSLLGQLVIGVAPADHKRAMALGHGVTNQRVVGLQVQDVELVDAGWHQQEGAFVHLGGERLVFDELEQVILKHHRALGGGNVFAHLEHAFVRHGHVALLHVVKQVLHAFGNAFTLGLKGLFLCLGIEGQEVAGRAGVDPLLHRKPNTGAGFGVALHGIGQGHERAGIHQVKRCRESRYGITGPGVTGKPAVATGFGLHALVPQGGHVPQVLGLDFQRFGWIDFWGGLTWSGQQIRELTKVGCARHTRDLAAWHAECTEGSERVGIARSSRLRCPGHCLRPSIEHVFLKLLGSFHPLGVKIHESLLRRWPDRARQKRVSNPTECGSATFQHTDTRLPQYLSKLKEHLACISWQ